jgi:hypothetical protein
MMFSLLTHSWSFRECTDSFTKIIIIVSIISFYFILGDGITPKVVDKNKTNGIDNVVNKKNTEKRKLDI